MENKNYTSAFLKSKYHLWFALATIGLGLLKTTLLGFIIGITAYVFGLLILPDLKIFTSKVDAEEAQKLAEQERIRIAEFQRRRDEQLNSLSENGKRKYFELAGVCKAIEKASNENVSASGNTIFNTGIQKLEELMWTYLRLIKIEESLCLYLEMERKEDVPSHIEQANCELEKLNLDLKKNEEKKDLNKVQYLQRYISSRIERIEVLKKRLQRIDTA